MANNKISYGITNVYYAKVTETISSGQYVETYATPVRLYGARAINLPATEENVQFAADNDANYFSQRIFSGYEGTLTMAEIDDAFRKVAFGEEADDYGLVGESLDDKPNYIALLFQFEGDDHETRHVLYKVSVGRPTIASNTRANTIEPNEIELPITAAGRISDGLVKWKCPNTTANAAQYAGWYSSVYVPTFTPAT